MRVKWLGNACLEIIGDRHIVIDPNYEIEPKGKADIVLVTHEHDDHFSAQDYEECGSTADLFAPKTTLDKIGMDGGIVQPGDEVDGIKVLESWCWGSEESVSYFYRGLLHAGDSARFPDVEQGVKAAFSACFPDYYNEYLSSFKRIDPEIVVPFHYDPSEDQEDADNLVKWLHEESIPCKLLQLGDEIKV